MDSALWLALGLIVFVLSNSCSGIGWIFSLAIGSGTTIAIWTADFVPMHRKDADGNGLQRGAAPTVRKDRTQRAKSLEMSKTWPDVSSGLGRQATMILILP
jgi:hypothetical protein